jgi:hypothetical protein
MGSGCDVDMYDMVRSRSNITLLPETDLEGRTGPLA